MADLNQNRFLKIENQGFVPGLRPVGRELLSTEPGCLEGIVEDIHTQAESMLPGRAIDINSLLVISCHLTFQVFRTL